MIKYSLMLTLFVFSSLSLLAFDFSFTEVSATKMKLAISDNSNNIIVVAHNSSVNPIAPGSAAYSAGNTFSEFKPNQITGEGNLVVYKGSEKNVKFMVSDLAPETVYVFDVYETGSKSPWKTFKHTTLALEPMQQVKNIGFSKVGKNDLTVLLTKGGGSRRIVLAREGKEPELPVDGREYKGSSTFGKGDKIGTDTYVVMLSSPGASDHTAKVENLISGAKYYFTALEANGGGEAINYNIKLEKKNQASKITLPEAPVAIEPADIKSNSFLAKWKEAKGAVSYEMDVATDNQFKNIIPEYKAIDVGKLSSILVEELPKQSKFFYRLRTIGEGGVSENSNIIEVSMK